MGMRSLKYRLWFSLPMFAFLSIVLIACSRTPAPTSAGHSEGVAVKLTPDEAKALGIPIYPGAVVAPGQESQASPVSTSEGMALALLQTGDSLQAVTDFYKEHLTVAGPDGKPLPPDVHQDKRDGLPVVSLSQSRGDGIKTAEIRQGDGVTMIELIHQTSAQTSGGLPHPGAVPGLPNSSGVRLPTSQHTAPRDQPN